MNELTGFEDKDDGVHESEQGSVVASVGERVAEPVWDEN
jgi:hypothetical protein